MTLDSRFAAGISVILDPVVTETWHEYFTDMTALHDFLKQLLDHGLIVHRSAAVPSDRPSPRAIAVLVQAFETFSLLVAGPRIEFDSQVACEASELVRQASWALVSRHDRPENLAKRLKLPGSPSTPSHHLSADLVLRYVPQILKRARGMDPSDPLAGMLTQILRRWPLSGVLSDVEEGPLVPLDFGGHPGLLLLYAERLVDNDRPSWRPSPPGPAWESYELVREEWGRTTRATRDVLVSG
jgi:hypothetical protein